MENPDVETKFWTTTKNRENTVGYFVFHTLGKHRGFYDWWSTLSVKEQENTRDDVVAIIRSVLGADKG